MIYSLTAISLFLLSIYAWRKNSYEVNRVIFSMVLIWLTLHDGLRWEIGTDWEPYFDSFYYDDNEHMGLTYRYINKLFHIISNSYTLFLLSFSAFFYFFLGKFFLKYSPCPLMSICLSYCGSIGIMGANRQLLAIVICLISLRFVFERKKIHFIFLILTASAIHITALSFIPVYFLYNLRYSKKLVIVAVSISFLFGILHVINKIPFLELLVLIDSYASTGTSLYLHDNDFSISVFGSIRRIILVAMTLYTRKYVKDEKYDFFLLLYIIGCCIYLLFNGSILHIVAGRGAIYYNLFGNIVIVYSILHFPIKLFQKEILWLAIFSLSFYLMWRDMNSYIPRVGFDIYNPYKSALL